MSGSAALARDLLSRASPLLSRAADSSTSGARAVALSAIDDFVRAPGPPRHLAAVRALELLARATRMANLDARHAERSFERGLDEVGAALGGEVARQLAPLGEGLASDRRAGARLSALAALATVRAELEARVTAEAAALRSRIAFAVPPPPAENRMACTPRRRPAQAAKATRRPPRKPRP